MPRAAPGRNIGTDRADRVGELPAIDGHPAEGDNLTHGRSEVNRAVTQGAQAEPGSQIPYAQQRRRDVYVVSGIGEFRLGDTTFVRGPGAIIWYLYIYNHRALSIDFVAMQGH